MSYRDRVRAMGRDAAEWWFERVSIMTVCGEVPEAEAEQAAFIQTVRRFGASKGSTDDEA